jgi:hypothetical protein
VLPGPTLLRSAPRAAVLRQQCLHVQGAGLDLHVQPAVLLWKRLLRHCYGYYLRCRHSMPLITAGATRRQQVCI